VVAFLRNPQFTNELALNWGESEVPKEKLHGRDSPFRMDFENYTIGCLVKDRGNYDYNHEGYRKIRAQILWRVEQLGWSNELFKEAETSIENERHWPRTGSDAKKQIVTARSIHGSHFLKYLVTCMTKERWRIGGNVLPLLI